MQIRTLVLRDPKEVPGSLPPLSRHKSERLATRYYLEFTSRSGKPWFQAPKREKKMGMFGRPRLGRDSTICSSPNRQVLNIKNMTARYRHEYL